MDRPETHRRGFLFSAAALLALAACGTSPTASSKSNAMFEGDTPQLHHLINQYADHYEVPRSLVHKVVQRESGYNPAARNGRYMGLMQIDPNTAAAMGFDGNKHELLDAETNLKYAVKYLRGAWIVSDGSENRAISWYSRGYYYEAKRRGLLGKIRSDS